ncbi:DNA primase large subunit [Gregarina niphandrodes]|uniref:DNA primase large subunit n=1 Tax=Gregarina niphandrodes TaxID=110365 RepID=A0A023BDE8_GRENI|nr:DNA primase large subunit [Gregarina niphandrodes]EZG88189.1 DNA primase large subunit [Gregarina niphandrodes]|eukprot:XP_011128613.1 DNA primase large subunit [Gregarina niphandrodes]
MHISRHAIRLKNQEHDYYVPICLPSCGSKLPHVVSSNALYKHVFRRLLVLIRIDDFFRTLSKPDIVNPALINQDVLQPPDLTVIVHTLLNTVYQDFQENTEGEDYPLLYRLDKTGDTGMDRLVSNNGDSTAAQAGDTGTVDHTGAVDQTDQTMTIDEEEAKKSTEVDELVVGKKRRRSIGQRGSMLSRQGPPPAASELITNSDSGSGIARPSLTRPSLAKLKYSSTGLLSERKGDKEREETWTRIIYIESMASAVLKIGFSNHPSRMQWLRKQETRLFAIRLGLWWIHNVSNSTALTELLKGLEAPYTLEGNKTVKMDSGICLDGELTLPTWTVYHMLIERFGHHEVALDKSLDAGGARSLRLIGTLDDSLKDVLKKLDSYEPEFASKMTTAGPGEGFKLSLAKIGEAVRYLPPCMNRLLFHMKQHRHLRHFGRLQLWPFLRDCGMSLPEQTTLHKRLWADPSKFDKEHIYTLRHIYGQEGKKEAKSCYGCSYIVGNQMPRPQQGDAHGCPFKELPADQLNKALVSCYGLKSTDIEDVSKTLQLEGPQLACRRLFNYAHPDRPDDDIGINPTNFYVNSVPSEGL